MICVDLYDYGWCRKIRWSRYHSSSHSAHLYRKGSIKWQAIWDSYQLSWNLQWNRLRLTGQHKRRQKAWGFASGDSSRGRRGNDSLEKFKLCSSGHGGRCTESFIYRWHKSNDCRDSLESLLLSIPLYFYYQCCFTESRKRCDSSRKASFGRSCWVKFIHWFSNKKF